MAVQLPDLWPSEVGQVKVLTPLFILRHQAGLLRKRSSNVLEAEVTSTYEPDRHLDTCHFLDLVVPALDRFRVRILNVRHSKMKVYPAYIAESEYSSDENGRSNSQAEFIENLGHMLKSDDTRSLIESLLAQATEALNEGDPNTIE